MNKKIDKLKSHHNSIKVMSEVLLMIGIVSFLVSSLYAAEVEQFIIKSIDSIRVYMSHGKHDFKIIRLNKFWFWFSLCIISFLPFFITAYLSNRAEKKILSMKKKARKENNNKSETINLFLK